MVSIPINNSINRVPTVGLEGLHELTDIPFETFTGATMGGNPVGLRIRVRGGNITQRTKSVQDFRNGMNTTLVQDVNEHGGTLRKLTEIVLRGIGLGGGDGVFHILYYRLRRVKFALDHIT